MLQRHKDIFFRVADELTCMIGVREPNPLADRWVSSSNHIPKGQKCKAKTANNENFRYGGLVVSPVLCPEGFTHSSLNDALDKWNNKFLQSRNLPSFFSCENAGPEKGLVKYNGFAIHADYDLMYICAADRSGNTRFTEQADQQRLFLKAQRLINLYIGKPMIQHGTELSWAGGVGAAESEFVYTFGPRRHFGQMMSTVSKNVKDWH